MTRTILVDDELRGINTIKKILELHCPDVTVVACCQSADEAKKQIRELQPDLVFLDIAMPGKTSIEMLGEMEAINFQVIFVTAHNEYSIQAFKYSAVDYLLKPVHENELVNAVERATKKIAQGQKNKNLEVLLHNLQLQKGMADIKICIHSLKGFSVLLLSEIVCCESEGSYTIFHLSNGEKITTSKSIIEYELMLEENDFMRIHRSFLINVQHVKSYERGEGGTLTLSNGKEVDVSRRKKDVFIQKMKDVFKY